MIHKYTGIISYLHVNLDKAAYIIGTLCIIIMKTHVSCFITEKQSTCILIKKGTKMPRWQSLALPFKKDTWIAVLVMALLAAPIFFALSRARITRYVYKPNIPVNDIA